VRGLVLSLFSGAQMFDTGFREEGFCVVSAGDVLFGQDVRAFHPPPGRFDGVIGGDPCQSHSAMANLVRARGFEPSFPDMTPEFERVVHEARPAWFLRENVPQAPDVKSAGYDVRSFLLDNSALDSGDGWGHEQMRRRRFWFGTRDIECPELRAFIDFALFLLPDAPVAAGGDHGIQMQGCKRKRQSVTADSRSVSVRIGGSGKVKATAVGGHDGHLDQLGAYKRAKEAPVTGRHESTVGAHGKDYSPPRRSLEDMLDLQGYPRDYFGKHSPFTMAAKRKMVGNAVSLPMSRALAQAVVKAFGERVA